MSTDRANKIIDEFMDGIAAANALRPSLMPRAPRRTPHPASRAASPRVPRCQPSRLSNLRKICGE